MNFQVVAQDAEIGAIAKSASEVKDLFRAYNIQIEEEDEEDDGFLPIEPIVEMTYDDSNDFSSEHDIAKRQLDELEAKPVIRNETKDVKRRKEPSCYNLRAIKNEPPTNIAPEEQSADSFDEGSITSDGREENGEGPFSYSCDLCGAAFRVKHSITKHKRVVHGMHQFSCMFCAESYPLKRNLLEHILSHRGPHGFKCDVCNKVRPTYISIQRHIKTHAEKSIPCDQCSARFKTKWELRSHEVQHQKDRNFECKSCKISFANPTKLRLHMARHNGYRPFACDVCGKDFSAQGNLTNHRKQHFLDKPYKCQYCSLTFLSATARKQHIPTHDTERSKPYECEDCKKKYSSTTSLAVHRLKFHSGGRTFSCNYCKKVCGSKQEISEHVAEHASERKSGHCAGFREEQSDDEGEEWSVHFDEDAVNESATCTS